MSESEQRKQRMQLLLDFDEQKRLVAALKVRSERTRSALEVLARAAYQVATLVSIEEDELVIGQQRFPVALVSLENLIANRFAHQAAVKSLDDLSAQAKSLGISLS